MTREAFERETARHLAESRRLHPAFEQEDAVKFVFQALLGVGHLLAGRDEVEARIAREMAGLRADPAEPLFEALSPAWCRLSLRRALAEGIPPAVIAGYMLDAPGGMPFTRADVLDFCRHLAESDPALIPDPAALSLILDERWLPSHSAAYRESARPAYRVIPARWMPLVSHAPAGS